MTTLARAHPSPELLDWIDSPSGAPGSPASFRIDDFIEGDRYVLRADIPGVDPDRDIDIEVAGELLTIRAQRRDERVSKRHKEVRYGELSRTVRLPVGSRTADIAACYRAGVLEVTLPAADAPVAQKVPITARHEEDE